MSGAALVDAELISHLSAYEATSFFPHYQALKIRSLPLFTIAPKMREVHRTNRKESWCSDKIRDSKRGQFTGTKPKTTNLSTNLSKNPTGGGDSYIHIL